MFAEKKIGITMLGGGLRAASYVGMLQAFEDKNIEISALVGSSGGAVVAASYAFGTSPEDLLEHFATFHPWSIFSPLRLARKQGVDYTPWVEHAGKLISPSVDLSEAKIPLAIHLTNIATQESEYLMKGNAVESVIASSAFLGEFELNGKRYADGEYDPETGANILKEMGAEYTMAVVTEVPEPITNRTLHFGITQKNAFEMDLQLHPVDTVHSIKLKQSGFLTRKWLKEYYQQGYEQTMEFIEEELS